ncbi:hypothetical protein JQC92_04995 [Shewanella sp. 202IG2-18]|uniref:hypothetical protein n=1 Tax=Parashewanella hymeniacidonis TaxID=2807618 RepID=UPI0019608497|nr:hypothetical protein [Parashewanella hymeniacidonis]MBM7071397.1 hypothetical protein [Parashewanella hymeniacidonis]
MIKQLLALSVLASATAIAVPLDVEEQRIPTALQELPTVALRYNALNDQLIHKVKASKEEKQLTKLVAIQGQRLWQQAVRDVQSGSNDDRPLYWSRLAMRETLKTKPAGFKLADWQRNILVKATEQSSRGINDVAFDDKADIKILLTGFDPFFLDKDIGQSNPSGLTALALDGYRFQVNGKQAQIETVMIPVRFADFDKGMIESILTPLYRNNTIDMLFTVSMGRKDFDLERFPGRNRSAKAPDNLNVYTGATADNPVTPMLRGNILNGNEFVEFTLPVKAMQSVKGDWAAIDNAKITTLKRGDIEAKSLAELNGETSVQGSGGGYLSNEISYRAIRLMNQMNVNIPNGHIHTPRIKNHDGETEMNIVNQIRQMVEAAVTTLPQVQ